MTDNTVIAAVPAQESHASQSRTLVRLASSLADKHVIDTNLYRDHLSFALALIDAFSFSAKLPQNARRKDELYKYKTEAITVALEMCSSVGLGKDPDANALLFLHGQDIGVVTVHTDYLAMPLPERSWGHEWCAIRRQHWAFAALEHAEFRKLLADYTAPGAKFTDDQFHRAAVELVPYYTYANYFR